MREPNKVDQLLPFLGTLFANTNNDAFESHL